MQFLQVNRFGMFIVKANGPTSIALSGPPSQSSDMFFCCPLESDSPCAQVIPWVRESHDLREKRTTNINARSLPTFCHTRDPKFRLGVIGKEEIGESEMQHDDSEEVKDNHLEEVEAINEYSFIAQ